MVLLRSKGRRKRFTVESRLPNAPRNRWFVLLKIERMSDTFFKKYFRMDKQSFQILLETITPRIATKSYNQIKLHAIHPKIKLGIALRFLAGGSYLDLSFAFDVPYRTIMSYVWEVFEAIDDTFNNIEFPLEDEEKLRKLEQGFMKISGGVFKGTVAAGDGVVFRMNFLQLPLHYCKKSLKIAVFPKQLMTNLRIYFAG